MPGGFPIRCNKAHRMVFYYTSSQSQTEAAVNKDTLTSEQRTQRKKADNKSRVVAKVMNTKI